MTNSHVAALLLTDMILGRENPWAEVFDPSRFKPATSARDFVRENMNVAKEFMADRVSTPELKSLDDIPPGHGEVVEWQGERVAELNRLVGEAVRRAASDEALDRLSRVYWFTIEFGVLREGCEVKAYGTGLLSSAGELKAISGADLRPLDPEAASRQGYDPTHYQPVLFCADSFESMYRTLRDYLVRWR